jgi:hypothetical protein
MDGVAGAEMKDAVAVDATGAPVPGQSYARCSPPIALSDEDAAQVFTIAIVAMLLVGVCLGWVACAVFMAVAA